MSFNVVINSPDTIDTEANNTKELRYNFDWNFMDDCEYDMTFSFRTTWQAVSSNGLIGPAVTQIRIPDLGAAMSVYEVGKNTTASKSNVIGNVTYTERMFGIAPNAASVNKAMLIAGAADNGPVRLKGRPQGNTFTVKLCKSDGSLATIPPDDYSLILHFKKIDRY